MNWQIIHADVLAGLATLPDESVQTVVTSPPYWGLRDYGTPGQLGLEPTPEAYVEHMVAVFREVRRVLRKDGTAWVNLGDSYAANYGEGGKGNIGAAGSIDKRAASGLKPKDLVGIPWRVAFALQSDGWYLRSDVIWSKPNPMPESVTDRPTKAHEYVFLLTRSARYFYDADAVREPNHLSRPATDDGYRVPWQERPNNGATDGKGLGGYRFGSVEAGRNLRSVWSIPTEPFPQAHFATFPKALVVPCVKAGTSEKGCCGECGAAFVRVTENQRNGRDWNANNRAGGDRLAVGQSASDTMPADYAPPRTMGWAPSCSHGPTTCPTCGSHDRELRRGVPWGTRMESGLMNLDRSCADDAWHTVAAPVPCTVLDPFAGSGTVGVVALRHGRSFIGIELSPEYAEMARERIRNDGPLFNVPAEVTT